jgi:plasmid stabilization system protein ParE
MSEYKIIWTNQAISALKAIFNFYKEKSPQGANRVKSDLLQCPKTIFFSQQYQIDDINPKYRRIIIRDFKVLYKYSNSTIYVMDIISTKQSPEILKNI